jgi:hypothetical protein
METKPAEPKKLFTFRSGGWALATGVALGLCLVTWRVIVTLNDPSGQPRGDGRHVETYGFDLTNLQVPPDTLVAGSRFKDYIRALVHPEHVSGETVPALNRAQRGKFLVSGDRVVGVTLNGESRAYPLRFIRWHEIINDTLGGVPIAVTYHYLCDSVAVFDRRVGDETLEFGVSGLLLNSNLLLYDRRPGQRGESLWCQITGRAIAGPAAATDRVLEPLPCRLLPWSVWFALTPSTTVMKPPGRYVLKKLYNMTPAPAYFSHDNLKFPVAPLPPAGDGWPARKSPVVAVRIDGRTVVYPVSRLEARADAKGRVHIEQGGVPLTFEVHRGPETALVIPGKTEKPVEIFHAFWFAWYAFHPGDTLFGS